MTTPKPATLERERSALYVTDAELARQLCADARMGKHLLRHFTDKEPTFPPKLPLWGGRRFMPAVRAWLEARDGLRMDTSLPPRRERRVR